MAAKRDEDICGGSDSDGFSDADEPDSRVPSVFRPKYLKTDSDRVKSYMERLNRTCAVCNLYLSPKSKFMDACRDTAFHTRCFYVRAEKPVTVNTTISIGIPLVAHASTYEKGTRLFKYFMSFEDTKPKAENESPFMCTACWAKTNERRTKSVLLELSGKGMVLNSEYEMIKSGTMDEDKS